MNVGRILTAMCGAVAAATGFLTFHTLSLAGRGVFEFGLPALADSEHGPIAFYSMVASDSPPGPATAWLVLGILFTIGPVYATYAGVRFILSSLSVARYGHVAAAAAIVSYSAAGWAVMEYLASQASSPAAAGSLSLSFWDTSGAGLWLAAGALVSGSIIREVTRD